MLAGYGPFEPATNFTAPVEFEESYWCHITEPCKEFLQSILKFKAAERGTAKDSAEHEWLTGPPPAEASAAILEELCKYGPPPCVDVLFWPAGQFPAKERQNSYVDLSVLGTT